MRAVLEGYIEQYLTDLAIGEDDHALNMRRTAKQLHARYQTAVGPMSAVRVGLKPYAETEEMVLKRMVNPEYGFPPLLRAQLLTKLGLPANYGSDILTNAPTAIVSTNSISSTNSPALTNATKAASAK